MGEPELCFLFSGGAPFAPLTSTQQPGDGWGPGRTGTGLRPARLLLPSKLSHQQLFSPGRGVSGGERDRQKSGTLAPLCYDTSTPRSAAAPSPVRSSVPPPRISCRPPGSPPVPVRSPRCGRGGAGEEALSAGDDSE